jgi:hypothetical protein
MKKKKKTKMYPDKTIPMKFHDPVSPMPMCGENFVSFQEWLKKKDKEPDKKMSTIKKKKH